jgi:spermidine synthase
MLFITGLLGIGYEVVGVRLLAQVLENTVYTYAAVLGIFLLGTALGAAIYHRLGDRWQLSDLLPAVAITSVLGVFGSTQANEFYTALRKYFGDSVAGVLTAEMLVASALFLLPTMAMGATFSHLAHSTRRLPGGLGRAVAINTLGAAAAPLAFSLVMVPWLGNKWAMVIIAASYVVASDKVTGWRWLAAAGVAFLALLPPQQLQFINVPAGGRLLEFREGVMASAAVVEDALAHRSLRVDNRFQMGGTGVADAEYRHAHIPLLLHPEPKRALFLGLGTGITFDAAALHTNVTADGVELLPEVIQVMPQFSPYNDSVRTNARLRMFVADARRFVQGTTNLYDVIVGDLFHPARDGAGSLYTVEHFRSIREHLTDGGLFCQWLPLHQLDEQTLRVITRTFLEVFPNAQAWLLRFNVETPVIGLIGTTAALTYSANWLERRAESPGLAERLQKLALADSIRLFGNLLADAGELRVLSNGARVNTDDNSAVSFGAPRFTYGDSSQPWERLAPFLELSRTNASTALGFGSPTLEGYWRARDTFLSGLIAENLGQDEQAHKHYIESARLSNEFTSGYARVLTIAMAKSKVQPMESRVLLEQLIEAQPSRPVARQLLERLFPATAP